MIFVVLNLRFSVFTKKSEQKIRFFLFQEKKTEDKIYFHWFILQHVIPEMYCWHFVTLKFLLVSAIFYGFRILSLFVFTITEKYFHNRIIFFCFFWENVLLYIKENLYKEISMAQIRDDDISVLFLLIICFNNGFLSM